MKEGQQIDNFQFIKLMKHRKYKQKHLAGSLIMRLPAFFVL